MNKVICDICGTAYPSAAKNCPICGSSREYALENAQAEDILMETGDISAEAEIPAAPRKKNKEIFDFDEVNQVKPSRKAVVQEDDFDDEDEEEEEEESRTNVGLVVVLIVLIVLLLLAAGFFFLKYLLPNMSHNAPTEPIATTEVLQTEPVETTDPGVPCTNLTMDGGKMELGENGKKLLNVHVYPEDTTDALTFASSDEAVAVVSEDGTVSAVGEGTCVITAQCGVQVITCNVTVSYAEVEVTVPQDTIPAPEAEGGEAADPNAETQPAEGTEPTDATEAGAEITEDTVLKLKKDDITIGYNYSSVQLELEGDIDPAELDWFTMDSTVAICHDGLVTATGSGLTRIYGEYKGQQVMCIVRCVF